MRCSFLRWPIVGSTAERLRKARLIVTDAGYKGHNAPQDKRCACQPSAINWNSHACEPVLAWRARPLARSLPKPTRLLSASNAPPSVLGPADQSGGAPPAELTAS